MKSFKLSNSFKAVIVAIMVIFFTGCTRIDAGNKRKIANQDVIVIKDSMNNSFDSNHRSDCYHGYVIYPNSNQVVDSNGRVIPCS